MTHINKIQNQNKSNYSENTDIPSGFESYAQEMEKNNHLLKEYLKKSKITLNTNPQTNWRLYGPGLGTACAKAYAMQGILKYHGHADHNWRTAYMPSISINNDAAYTITSVSFTEETTSDQLYINNQQIYDKQLDKVTHLLDFVRELGNSNKKAIVKSKNIFQGNPLAKGLGTSASAGAALAKASIGALLGVNAAEDQQLVSCTARLLSGSAARSAAGGLSLWMSYPGISHRDCFAVRLDIHEELQHLSMITIPIMSQIALKTEDAHASVTSSPFFQQWTKQRSSLIIQCIEAMSQSDLKAIGQIAEQDSMKLHAVSMTTTNNYPLIAWEPENIPLFHMCHRLRSQNIPVYFSIDTGPSIVFLTHTKHQETVMENINMLKLNVEIIPSKIGGPAKLISAD
ncbi:MAG TPA: GHMP kinase [Chloroflexi bacterium]|nr:GHMP kinase [Chloroflexota bacterium]|tara:strand:- start:1932 stop:3131 length:1200 start_codon:yes stop_codon:yes gene_type:complete